MNKVYFSGASFMMHTFRFDPKIHGFHPSSKVRKKLGFIKAKPDLKMFIHMLTVECTNLLCSNMSNTIQHCSLRCKGHKIIIICIIMHPLYLSSHNSGPAHLPYINLNMPFYPINLFLCSLQTHAAVLGMCPDPRLQYIICRGAEVRSNGRIIVLRMSQSAIIWECVDEYYAAAIWY